MQSSKTLSAGQYEIEADAEQASKKRMRSIATTRVCLDTGFVACSHFDLYICPELSYIAQGRVYRVNILSTNP